MCACACPHPSTPTLPRTHPFRTALNPQPARAQDQAHSELVAANPLFTSLNSPPPDKVVVRYLLQSGNVFAESPITYWPKPGNIRCLPRSPPSQALA